MTFCGVSSDTCGAKIGDIGASQGEDQEQGGTNVLAHHGDEVWSEVSVVRKLFDAWFTPEGITHDSSRPATLVLV